MKAKIKKISISSLLFLVMVLTSVMGLFAACGPSKKDSQPIEPPAIETPSEPLTEYVKSYQTKTSVGYKEEFLGEVERNVPKGATDGGLETGYPVYGKTLALTTEQKNAIITENKLLTGVQTSKGGTYDKMDENGNLFLNGEKVVDENGVQRKLYKHTGSIGLYCGDVDDNEKAISKRITYKKRGYDGYGITGMYAPAGEVIKIQISKEDMDATDGIRIHIGQALYNGQANDIWNAKAFNRMPVILNTMDVNKDTAVLEGDTYTAYVGSFLGGPIYIRNENVTFTVTVSGGVRYSHFILGYTTEEEFELNKKSSAPYFDLEVWDFGVLHSGPKVYSERFNYKQLYDVAVYWDKVALVSNKITSQGIVFLYDPFVAAGAAVAFPGRRSVNCPMGWMSGSLDYNNMVTTGAWGNMHEYNHNFQSGWGRGAGTEVTNNAVSLIEYALFTKISAGRQLGNYGASGLSGWNTYTTATWSISQALAQKRDNDLSVYSTVLHNFGPDMFIKSIKQQQGRYKVDMSGWCRAISEATHNDMTYYFSNLVPGYSIDEATTTVIKEQSYPVFIPVASVYQTGRSFMYDGEKQYFTSQYPYQIEKGKDFTFDLSKYTMTNGIYTSGSIVLPEGFNFTIKSVSQPESGEVTKIDEFTYKYHPGEKAFSGKIIVTLQITPPTNADIEVEDVDLVIEFEQTQGLNRNMLERTIYTYEDGKMPKSAEEAYNTKYEGCTACHSEDNTNPVQNSNTDIWYTDRPNTNQVVEVRGKLYADEAGKYRIALRGRFNVALYVSIGDDQHFEHAASYVQTSGSPNFPLTEGTYKDYTLEGGTWIYIKEVMINGVGGGKYSFIGLGFGKFTPAVPELDEYGDPTGKILTPESVKVDYASAYRNSYEFPKTDFTSEYFYTKDYEYKYAEESVVGKDAQLLETNFVPWQDSVADKFAIQHLFDENPKTDIHSVQNVFVTEQHPYYFTVDMGKEIKANEVTFNGYSTGAVGNQGMPKDFVISASLDNVNYEDILTCTEQTTDKKTMTVSFDTKVFRYFKFTVTKTDNNRYFALNSMKFDYTLPVGEQLNLDEEGFLFMGNWKTQNELSSFGHLYVGEDKATLEFEFVGTRLAVLTSISTEQNFEVYVDDHKVTLTSLLDDVKNNQRAQMTNLFDNKKHNVKIVCTGSATIDSVVVWH